MRPASYLKSTPLRLALSFSFLFIVSFLVAGTGAYLIMKENLGNRLDRQISETFATVEALYQKGNRSAVITAIDRMAGAAAGHDNIYLVRSPDGLKLAGNIPRSPPADGWIDLDAPALGVAEDDLQFRVYSAGIGDLRLTVGASLETSAEILETALSSFAWATLAVLVFAIAGGTLLGIRAQRRIDLIAGTMNAVGEGRLDMRIPITRTGDDLDRLSAQINAALDRLKGLIEGMRQVSSDIAHDLKTPINRLHIAIETALERADEGEPDPGNLREALAEAKQINETFDALLRIAQIEAGARRARFAAVDLKGLLETIFDAYGPVAEENQQNLSLAISDRKPIAILGDRELLLQMVANLVANAIRHTPKNTAISLEVRTLAMSGEAEIVVADSGPGIPSGEREKVLRRLYRLEESRTTPGSGLGLSLVKAIADLHRASIELSENHPGLRVAIRFPAHNKFNQ